MKEKLLRSAKSLNPPSKKVIKEFSQKRDQLTALCTQAFEKRLDIEKLVGKNNIQMARDNNINFARFMESIFHEYQPDVIVETVLWVFRAYRAHGFKTTYWPANLNIWVNTMRKELSQESFNGVYPFYNWLIVNIPLFVKITSEDVPANRAIEAAIPPEHK